MDMLAAPGEIWCDKVGYFLPRELGEIFCFLSLQDRLFSTIYVSTFLPAEKVL